VFQRQRLELRGLHEAALLGAVDEKPNVLDLEDLLRLTLAHSSLRSICFRPGLKLSHSRVRLLA